MHGQRRVLELEEGAITFAPRACIDDATGKYCISQQGSLYQLGVPAADEALEAAAPAAAKELSEEGWGAEGGVEKRGWKEEGEPAARGSVLDSGHGLPSNRTGAPDQKDVEVRELKRIASRKPRRIQL